MGGNGLGEYTGKRCCGDVSGEFERLSERSVGEARNYEARLAVWKSGYVLVWHVPKLKDKYWN